MEKIITIVALVLSIAGLGYLKSEQLKRMAAEQEAAAAMAAELAAQMEAEAAAAAAEAAKIRFTLPHDSDPGTAAIDLVLDGSSSSDLETDSISYRWEQIGGDAVNLEASDLGTTSFTATSGEYTFRLTVTDTYGDASTGEATVAVMPEPNSPPNPAIRVFEKE